MLRFFLFLFFIGTAVTVYGQTPETLSYQAIIRDNQNELITDADVSLKISIRQYTFDGTSVFEETHLATTNVNGLVSLEIGLGDVSIGDFTKIPWYDGPFFVETRVDPDGSENYSILAVSQLLSVPYALHSKTAEKLVGAGGTTPVLAQIISFQMSRAIRDQDIGNTIECTSSATLNLTQDFNMDVGTTINFEAHNGAVLTIVAEEGVSLNYTQQGQATLESDLKNVRFGILRKIAANSYIVSGQ